ncbi:MAG: gamma-glutamylcyclotransferase, partial [Desulfobacterota bacterium]|nr:gamma-glutamylcyclotransferase [Thermodesulfobacteriota bacterium]
YFAYGSNLSRRQMRRRCPDARVVGTGRLDGYRWIINSRGFATIVPSENDVVWGTIFSISSSDERALDGYEGVSEGFYVKEYLPVAIGNEYVECLVYVARDANEGNPSKEYVRRIQEGLHDANLPEEYIQKYLNPFLQRQPKT